MAGKLIKFIPIKTFLIYFIIAAFIIIAFKFPFDEISLGKTQAAVVIAAEKPVPSAEICDGIDNDINGIIDDNLTVKTQKCSTGLCESTQSITCESGKWITQECPGLRWATPEVCDGLDNDCNGYIDNILNPPHCDYYQGVCAGFNKTCGGEKGWLRCPEQLYDTAYRYEHVETDCIDKLDNDCDGQTDVADPTDCHVHTNE